MRTSITLVSVAAALALAGSAQAQGNNPPGVNPTHYECYRVEAPPKEIKLRSLRDQFGVSEGVLVARPMFLCAPTAKNGAAPRDRTTHYLCYENKGVKPANRKALVTNQFGRMQLAVEAAAMLCVPSLKRLL